MKALLFYQHFWPDSPPYANMLRAIGSHLGEQGHSVSMLTGVPSYKTTDRRLDVPATEIVDGINVRRLGLLPGSRSINLIRMLSKALWPIRALIAVIWDALRGRRHDVIVAATIPPVINGACGLLAARLIGARFIYHLQDIYPEIGSAGELWNDHSIKHKLLLAIDGYICRQADKCVVLSQDMADALADREVNAANIHIINNFMLVNFDGGQNDVVATSEELPDSGGRFRVVFAGNLGRFQGLEALLTAFLERDSAKDDLELHFLGEGAAMQGLIDLAGDHKRVFFHGHKPFEKACVFMASCDAGVVSIQPNIYKFAYPSKTLTYLGQGLPVFALVEQQSALAREVTSLQLGVTASNANAESLKAGFSDLSRFLNSDANDRQRIRATTDSLYSREVAMSHWSELLGSVFCAPPAKVSGR